MAPHQARHGNYRGPADGVAGVFFRHHRGERGSAAGLLPDTKPGFPSAEIQTQQIVAGSRRPAAARRCDWNGASQLRSTAGGIFCQLGFEQHGVAEGHYKDIDLLIPEQLHSVTADGALTTVDYENGQSATKTTPEQAIAILKEDKLHQWMKSVNIEIPMMGLAE